MAAAPGELSTTAWPSAAPLATSATPIWPAAPGLFSTTTGWPKRSARCGPMVRAIRSTLPPGGNGTTMRTGLLGKLCANAAEASDSETATMQADLIMSGCSWTGALRWPRQHSMRDRAGIRSVGRPPHARGAVHTGTGNLTRRLGRGDRDCRQRPCPGRRPGRGSESHSLRRCRHCRGRGTNAPTPAASRGLPCRPLPDYDGRSGHSAMGPARHS